MPLHFIVQRSVFPFCRHVPFGSQARREVQAEERCRVDLLARSCPNPAGVEVDEGRREVELSMILKWYGSDFGTQRQLLEFLAEHTSGDKQAALRRLLAAGGVKLRYRPYDWTSNAAE